MVLLSSHLTIPQAMEINLFLTIQLICTQWMYEWINGISISGIGIFCHISGKRYRNMFSIDVFPSYPLPYSEKYLAENEFGMKQFSKKNRLALAWFGI